MTPKEKQTQQQTVTSTVERLHDPVSGVEGRALHPSALKAEAGGPP